MGDVVHLTLYPVSSFDTFDPLCANCSGEGWVCEDHPEIPWGDGDGCCGGAGSPCSCNELSNHNG